VSYKEQSKVTACPRDKTLNATPVCNSEYLMTGKMKEGRFLGAYLHSNDP
jgi:hypothetical protein